MSYDQSLSDADFAPSNVYEQGALVPQTLPTNASALVSLSMILVELDRIRALGVANSGNFVLGNSVPSRGAHLPVNVVPPYPLVTSKRSKVTLCSAV